MRQLWRHYYSEAAAVIFVVDSSCPDPAAAAAAGTATCCCIHAVADDSTGTAADAEQDRPTTPADGAAQPADCTLPGHMTHPHEQQATSVEHSCSTAAARRHSSGAPAADSTVDPEDDPTEARGAEGTLQLAGDTPPGCMPAEPGAQHTEERPEQASAVAACAEDKPICSPAAHTGTSSQPLQHAGAAATIDSPPPAAAAGTSWYGCQPSKRAAAPLADVLAGVLDSTDVKVCPRSQSVSSSSCVQW